ncbi:MAG: helix-turn-helix transcriptional regulator [Acutalibacteraceae bacterium]|jgi:AraC family transcriptional regulator
MDERVIAVQKMQKYIEEHIFEEIKIDDLAELTMYSMVHVRRLFLEWLNMSPADYIRRLKLSKAALMLRDKPCRIIDIVTEFGFGSVDGFQRAFKKEFGYNPKDYRTNPVPIYLFTPYGVLSKVQNPYTFSPTNTRKVTVQRIHKSARKAIVKRGIKATDYWSYCNEIGCDVWGLLTSMKSIDGEPVCLWLPEQFRNPQTNEYVQGVEVENDCSGVIPEGFDVIEFPESDYLLFCSDPYDDEEYGSAILDVQKVISEYDYTKNGYKKDDKNPRIQLEPIGTRGYIELVPIINILSN